jgi:hypothetical protein
MSSTPLVAWRTFMPSFLAEPWRRYQSLAANDPQRWECALQVMQRMSRYLTGLYASFGPSSNAPGPYRNLVKRIDRPTVGMWWDAAEALAQPVSTDQGPIGESARALLDETVQRALETLIGARNEAAHRPNDGLGFHPNEIRARLPDIDAAIHTIVRAFACLAQLRLFYVRGTKSRLDGTHVHDALVFGANDGLSQEIPTKQHLPSEFVYAVSPTGVMVLMYPWVHVVDHTGGMVPGLLSPQTDKAMTWTGAGAASASKAAEPKAAVAQLKAAINRSRRRFSLDAALTEQLCSAGVGADTPMVRGWTLVQRLGGGSNADVWLAHPNLGSQNTLSVLKIVHAAAQSDQTSIRRFEREIAIGRAVSHPHLVRCVDVTETTTGRSVMVQEYVLGESLEVRLRIKPALSPSAIARLGAQVGMALLALHEHGVVHRDVKPANILIEPGGSARLIDLGVAHEGGKSPITSVHQGIGTDGFSAPEQRGGAPASSSADAYSLGRVLAEALRARYTENGIQHAPTQLRDVARSLMAKSPSERMPLSLAVAAIQRPEILDNGVPAVIGDVLPGDWTVVAAPGPLADVAGAWAAPVRSPTGQQAVAWLAMGSIGPKVIRNRASAKGLGCSEQEGLTIAIKLKNGPEPAAGMDTATAIAAGVGTGAVVAGIAGAVILGAGAIGAAAGLKMRSSVPPSNVPQPIVPRRSPNRAVRTATQAAKATSPLAIGLGWAAKILAAKTPKKK